MIPFFSSFPFLMAKRICPKIENKSITKTTINKSYNPLLMFIPVSLDLVFSLRKKGYFFLLNEWFVAYPKSYIWISPPYLDPFAFVNSFPPSLSFRGFLSLSFSFFPKFSIIYYGSDLAYVRFWMLFDWFLHLFPVLL